MKKEDIESLSENARNDGVRLFKACQLIYTLSLIFISLMAIVNIGIASALIIMWKEFYLIGFGIIAITIISSILFYTFAVLITHIGKVMVHTSFSSLGILENLSSKEN